MNPRCPRARLAVGPRHLLPVAALACGLVPGRAELIYSGWKDLTIPTGQTGIYLDFDTGTTSFDETPGWDISPFFGGTAIANNTGFQPVRFGPGANQFQENAEGYLGFKFTTNAGAGPYYGWMRLVLTGNLARATARVAQRAPVSSTQIVTLSPAAGETFTSAMGVRAGERGQDGAAPTRLRWLGDRWRCASSRDFRNQ